LTGHRRQRPPPNDIFNSENQEEKLNMKFSKSSWHLQVSSMALGTALVLGACSPISKEAKEDMAQPVNCHTAEGDIRVLESEKSHVAKQILDGVTAITPAGAVVGILTGTEGEKLQVATGDYNNKIEQKITEIKQTCGL
jgi:hypothetical protein